MANFSFGDKASNDPTKTNRWLTPNWIVEELGSFDLDPCGAPGQQESSRQDQAELDGVSVTEVIVQMLKTYGGK